MCLNKIHTCTYYTLRSGGLILLTMLFDSMFVVLVKFPLAFVLSRFTDIHVLLLVFIVYNVDIIEVIIGYILVDRGIWLKKIV